MHCFATLQGLQRRVCVTTDSVTPANTLIQVVETLLFSSLLLKTAFFLEKFPRAVIKTKKLPRL